MSSLASAQAETDLSRFSQLPDSTFADQYPAETRDVIARLEAHWDAGDTVHAVYYGMYAPVRHEDAIVRWVLAKLPMLSSPYYFLLSRLQFVDVPDEAVVWHLVAGVNAFYDAGRCALEESNQQVQHLFSINRQAIAWKEVLRQRGTLAPLLQRAVDWLRANPELPAPDYLCPDSLDSERARNLREDAVNKLSSMVAEDSVPAADTALQDMVRRVMDARQDLLLTRLSLQNLEQRDEDTNRLVVEWARQASDALLLEYLALPYLKYWDLEIAEQAYRYHASPLGEKMLQNEINERLGLGGQYIRLSESEQAEFQQWMETPAMQRMHKLRKSVAAYQKYLLRMAAGDPRP